jgi:hypothetical protein
MNRVDVGENRIIRCTCVLMVKNCEVTCLGTQGVSEVAAELVGNVPLVSLSRNNQTYPVTRQKTWLLEVELLA